MRPLLVPVLLGGLLACSTAEDLEREDPETDPPSADDPGPSPSPTPPPGSDTDPEAPADPEDDLEPVPDPPEPEPTPDPPPSPTDPPWDPRPFEALRFVVFYQLTADVLPVYADLETGLPFGAGHQYVFTVSHASTNASRVLADKIHDAREDFLYAPAFDLNSRPGWGTASDVQLRAWAHEFRDEALAKHADLFAFNEAPTATAENAGLRVAMAKLLRFLNEPNAEGRRLRGVFFLTHRPSMPENWATPAPAFWEAIDETCDAVVVEHYHSHSFVCGSGDGYLADHFFRMRDWLNASGEPAKVSIANRKYTVLHSSRYAPGTSGWQGADSTVTSLPAFQRNLSKVTRVTRATPGGLNRISYAPTANNITAPGVHPRIALLARWHYEFAEPDPIETTCVAGAAVNCRCD